MINKILKRLIPQEKRTQLYRLTKRILSMKKRENYYTKHDEIMESGQDVFQGYYDIDFFRGDRLLFNRVSRDGRLDICLKTANEPARTLSSTRAWCWQQGCRLRWLPGENEKICWNAWDGNDYYAVIYDLTTGDEVRISRPLYDIDPQGKRGASLNFTRLGYMRPGYGYTNAPFDMNTDLSNEGIDLVDLENNTSFRVVTYEAITDFMGRKIDLKNCYLNHLSFDPSGNNLMFFFIEKGKIHQASLFVYQISEHKLIPLELENSVSHYCWISEGELLITAYDTARNCHYYRYDLSGSKEIFMADKLMVDGHPTWVNDHCVITDTYPDAAGFQKVLKVDPQSGSVKVLADLYSTERRMGEQRTDLHPRVDVKGGKICIDSNVKGYRKVVILEEDFDE